MTKRKIIIDTDPGQDDAVAILVALGSPDELDVLAIQPRSERVAEIDGRVRRGISGISNLLTILKPVLSHQSDQKTNTDNTGQRNNLPDILHGNPFPTNRSP